MIVDGDPIFNYSKDGNSPNNFIVIYDMKNDKIKFVVEFNATSEDEAEALRNEFYDAAHEGDMDFFIEFHEILQDIKWYKAHGLDDYVENRKEPQSIDFVHGDRKGNYSIGKDRGGDYSSFIKSVNENTKGDSVKEEKVSIANNHFGETSVGAAQSQFRKKQKVRGAVKSSLKNAPCSTPQKSAIFK